MPASFAMLLSATLAKVRTALSNALLAMQEDYYSKYV